MKIHGFTLLELMITIAVAAILLGLAVPNMHTFIQNNRIAGQTNDILAALNLARSEALKRNREAWLCPSQNAHTNTPSCSGNDWTDGWLVVAQSAAPGNTVVIRAWPGNDIQIDTISFHGPAPEVRYSPSGAIAGTVNDGTHSDCPNAVCLDLEITNAGCRSGEYLGFRRIVIPSTGSTRVVTESCQESP